jgi:hypothetical protein
MAWLSPYQSHNGDFYGFEPTPIPQVSLLSTRVTFGISCRSPLGGVIIMQGHINAIRNNGNITQHSMETAGCHH